MKNVNGTMDNFDGTMKCRWNHVQCIQHHVQLRNLEQRWWNHKYHNHYLWTMNDLVSNACVHEVVKS